MDGKKIRRIIAEPPIGASPEIIAEYKTAVAEEDQRVEEAVQTLVVKLLSPTAPNEGPLFLRGPADAEVSSNSVACVCDDANLMSLSGKIW